MLRLPIGGPISFKNSKSFSLALVLIAFISDMGLMHSSRYEFWSQDDYITEEWFLFETLLWISDQRLPYAGESAEWFLKELQEGGFKPIPPDLSRSRLMHLDQSITGDAGLGPCPMIFYHSISHVDDIERTILDLEGFLKISKGVVLETYKKQIQELEDLLHDRAEWMVDLEAYLDEAKTQLFMLLRKGEITAYGAKLPTRSMDAAKRYVIEHSVDYRTAKTEPISPSAWSLSNVLWCDCAVQTLASTYVCVHLKRDDLLELVRPIFNGPVNGGYIDGYMITKKDSVLKASFKETEEVPKTKTGRRSYNWDAFHIEVTRRILNGTLPAKQMAGVSDFQTWFIETQSQIVGQSTIAEKISPYYREFVWPKSRK